MKKGKITLEIVSSVEEGIVKIGDGEYDLSKIYGLPCGFIYYDLTTKTLYIGEDIEYDFFGNERLSDNFCTSDVEYMVEVIGENCKEVEEELNRLSGYINIGKELNTYIRNNKEKLEGFGVLGVEFSKGIFSDESDGSIISGIKLMTKDDTRDDIEDVLSHYLGIDLEDGAINEQCYDVIDKLLGKDIEDFRVWVSVFDVLNRHKGVFFWNGSGFDIIDGGIKFWGDEWLNEVGRELFAPLLDQEDTLHFDSLEELDNMLCFIDEKIG